MSANKIAIVTGGNKGIGYAIVKGLCKNYNGVVYFTSRDEMRGRDATKSFNDLGFKPLFHQLDINDLASVSKFKNFIADTKGTIDLLINNAGFAYKHDAKEPFGIQARDTVDVNYFGTLRLCDALFPLLGQNARVVNVSSVCGHLSKIPSQKLRDRLSNPNLTVDGLNELMNEFVRFAEANTNVEQGWGKSAYNASKVGVSALTRIQQRIFDAEQPNRNISVNSVHPGYVSTDMTSHLGPLTVEEGAFGPLYLALEPHGLKGQYVWRDGGVIDWLASSLAEPY